MKFNKPKTVEQIIAPITTIVDQLRVHADTQHGKANNHADEAQRRLEAERVAREEANKANTTAEKVAALIR